MQSTKIHTLWGPSRAGSLTPPRHRRVPASPSLPQRGRRRDDGRRVVVRYHIMICAPRDASVSLHQAYRARKNLTLQPKWTMSYNYGGS